MAPMPEPPPVIGSPLPPAQLIQVRDAISEPDKSNGRVLLPEPNNDYIGEVVLLTETHLVQRVANTIAIAHELRRLDIGEQVAQALQNKSVWPRAHAIITYDMERGAVEVSWLEEERALTIANLGSAWALRNIADHATRTQFLRHLEQFTNEWPTEFGQLRPRPSQFRRCPRVRPRGSSGADCLMRKIVLSAFLAVPALIGHAPAKASEWGCEVLLCLANPEGPTATPACVPPITRLWQALRKTKPDPFPSCDEAGDSFAKQGYGHYDLCPQGTTVLASGVRAIQLNRVVYAELAKANPVYFGRDLQASTRQAATAAAAAVHVGIGEVDGIQAASSDSGSTMPAKVCVRGELGAVAIPGATYEEGTTHGTAFEQVIVVPPHASPRYIDVHVNGQLHNRVRY